MAKKTAQKVDVKTLKSVEALRKGFRAYVGVYGAAYDRILPVVASASKNYTAFAVKGEAMETAATVFAKDARVRAEKSYGGVASKVRAVFPKSANDRVAELEAEIADLNKKIVRFSKKATKKTATRTQKVVETVKTEVTAKAEQVAEAIKAA